MTTTYTWDAENRLKATEGGGTSTIYDYDYSGIRVSQTVNGVETRFLVDKNRNYAQVLAEYAPSGTVQVSYVFGSDLISQDRNGTKSFYVYDGLGSTRALTDASGMVTDTYNYDAYGNLSSSTGTTVNSYLYAGEQFDKNLGDYYLRDRYYSTDIGRFTQRDRFEGVMNNPLSLNRYGYTHGNPVNAIDPSGEFSLLEVSAISSVVGALSGFTYNYAYTGDLKSAAYGAVAKTYGVDIVRRKDVGSMSGNRTQGVRTPDYTIEYLGKKLELKQAIDSKSIKQLSQKIKKAQAPNVAIILRPNQFSASEIASAVKNVFTNTNSKQRVIVIFQDESGNSRLYSDTSRAAQSISPLNRR
ncbi:RHS repeat-associated core domain-containing protein [Pseudanabaena sp. UWO310]|uniref:RHS repeat-associated core domain-containing protein n=1 Tax=Pseudanabaena sp. UWO310 TaxID=2480795 RepID=UPI001CC1C266|nr:RHS repeat-associated core domain-containing protein [Pseudanabaena sp. UWO310]